MSSYLDGIIGGVGLNAYTSLAASFVQPAVGANVSVQVASSAWAAVGLAAFVEVGGNYQVAAVTDATHLALTNLGGASNAGVGTTVPANGRVTSAGAPGVPNVIPAPALVATSNVVLNSISVIDTVATNTIGGKDVLCVAQTNPVENGYWTPSGGAWSRPAYYATDTAVAALLSVASAAVTQGLLGAGSIWSQQSGSTLAGAKTFARLPDAASKALVIAVPIPVYNTPATPWTDTAAQTAITAQINTCLAQALARGGGCTVQLPQGYDYYINGDLICDGVQGVTIVGGGGLAAAGGTRIIDMRVSPLPIGFSSFAQPAIGANVTATVTSASNMVALQYWRTPSDDANTLGSQYFQVVSVSDANHVVLKNIGSTGNTAPGGTVAANFLLLDHASIQMRSCYGCKVEDLTILAYASTFTGRGVNCDGTPFASDGGHNAVERCYIRTNDFNAGPTLAGNVGAQAVTLTGTNIYTIDFVLEFILGGARGVATYRYSTNGGLDWEETGVVTAATHACLGTAAGLTLNFPNVTYGATDKHRALQGMQRGANHNGGFSSRVRFCQFYKVQNAIYLNGLDHIVEGVTSNVVDGYTVLGVNAGGAKINISPEPGGTALTGGRGGLRMTGGATFRPKLFLNAGDSMNVGPWVTLDGCTGADIDGVFSLGAGAAIKLNGGTNHKVKGNYLGCPYVFDFSGSSTAVGITCENLPGRTYSYFNGVFTFNLWNPAVGSNVSDIRFTGTSGATVPQNTVQNLHVLGETIQRGRLVHPPYILNLVNGANGAASINAGAATWQVAGPSAAYAINGVTAGYDGQRMRFVIPQNLPVTITDEAGGETAANRIRTRTGANVVLPANASGSWFVVEYVASLSRWVLAEHTEALGNADVPGVRNVLYNGWIDSGSMGAAKTIDLNTGAAQKGLLTAACTLTITLPTAICSGAFKFTQDATGGRALTWPAGTKSPLGSLPQPSSGANDVTYIDWFYDPDIGLTVTTRGKYS